MYSKIYQTPEIFILQDNNALFNSVHNSVHIDIPVSILRHNSSLEAIVLYLKDVLNYKFSKIAALLNRNQRTIWATYHKSRQKRFSIDTDNISLITIPLSVLSSRNFSVLESIVLHLKITYGLSFSQISGLLGKNYRTIWTVYRRAIIKIEHAKQ
jgi:transposase-like protein